MRHELQRTDYFVIGKDRQREVYPPDLHLTPGVRERKRGIGMKDNRTFKDVIRTIKGTEKDKDKFLKASRLSRHERPQMDFETMLMLMTFGTMWLGMILFFLGTR